MVLPPRRASRESCSTRVSAGYDDAVLSPAVLKTVDGESVGNMRDLVRLVDSGTAPFVTFVFDSGAIVALDRSLCAKHDPDTLAMNAIPSRYSADLEPARSGAWCGSLFARAFR